MRVAVFGMGYVGTVCGTCLAHHRHQVIGVDVQQTKVDLVNNATAPVVEPGLQEMLSAVVGDGRFSATTDIAAAMEKTDIILLCVGTPSRRDGSLNLSYLENVIQQVATHLGKAVDFPVIAIRSTVPPGTLAHCTALLAEHSGATPGSDFGVVSNPEFLREGSALSDFENPPYTLVGTDHERAIEPMKKLYAHLSAPFMATASGPAEIIKYINNSFHALKITFANEVGVICKSFGIDSHQVMEIFCADKRLNISPAYLKPGFPYGGSCLPKDLEALNQAARQRNLRVPVLSHIAESNSEHLNHCIQLIEDSGKHRLGFLGLSFKAQTDDLRESPAVKVVETLLGRGYDIRVFDPYINIARLVGANREYIENHIRHLSALLVPSVEELLEFGETIIVTNNDKSYADITSRTGEQHTIIDMTRLPGSSTTGGNYHGVCW